METLVEILKKMPFFVICCYCKSVLVNNIWHETNPEVEKYIIERFKSRKGSCGISHGFCPTCDEQIVKPQIAALDKLTLKELEQAP